uniref:Putative secreted protein n=1 Tax=Anopheles darlingi TaxID=43151 RepID=A0A2M4DCY9_ANODA
MVYTIYTLGWAILMLGWNGIARETFAQLALHRNGTGWGKRFHGFFSNVPPSARHLCGASGQDQVGRHGTNTHTLTFTQYDEARIRVLNFLTLIGC